MVLADIVGRLATKWNVPTSSHPHGCERRSHLDVLGRDIGDSQALVKG
jgi:hypothetical protein